MHTSKRNRARATASNTSSTFAVWIARHSSLLWIPPRARDLDHPYWLAASGRRDKIKLHHGAGILMAVRVSIFISHSWSYSDHYDTLAEWLFEKRWQANGTPLVFVDHSVPRENPIHYAADENSLTRQIFEKMREADVSVIPTGMYANFSYWIGKEIAGATAMKIPILAVNPWGQMRTSSVVSNAAAETVGWNSNSVASGVWKLYQRQRPGVRFI